MRKIERTSAFKRDYKREAKGRYRAALDDVVRDVVTSLATDQPLPVKYRDHSLSGDWDNYRECHLKPDLLLIYSLPDSETLHLVRLGSHSELFG